jgi:nicotinate-nucleotide pyrophosphorylase
MPSATLASRIGRDVRDALAEDLGSGDVTAQLIPEDRIWKASVYSRENAILCGSDWFDAVFQQLDARVEVVWYAADGAAIAPHQVVCTLQGPSRTVTRVSSKAWPHACWIPAKRSPACARPRNTRCAAAAATIIALVSTTRF